MHSDNSTDNTASLQEIDRRHLWHPYSSPTSPDRHYAVASASGVRITLADGRELIDGMASWWSVIHGYNHPRLNRAIETQLQKVAHVMFGGLTHEPAVKLAQQLIALAPPGLEKVFFSDSGSVAVEVAMKMAIQFWHAQGHNNKNRFLTIRQGYHGDTFGAMSVCDPVTGMHGIYRNTLAQQLFAPAPQCRFGEDYRQDDIDALRSLIDAHKPELAAVILEPIVQGAGAMRFYSSGYLSEVRKLCDAAGLLLICDEIATGFGRSGKFFACDHSSISPDILCLGKALTGGYLSLAATLTTERISATIGQGKPGVFMHGPTFMANPLACAVSSASIELLHENDWRTQIERLQAQMIDELTIAREFELVKEVRVLGGIAVLEMQHPVNMGLITRAFVDRGVWLRPFGKLVYIMPPYVITQDELTQLTDAMLSVAQDASMLQTN